MGLENSTEKMGKSWFRNLVSQAWLKIIPALPPIISNIAIELHKQLPGPTEFDWNDWCDKLAKDKIIDKDTVEIIKSLFKDPYPLNLFEMFLSKLAVVTGKVESAMNIYDLDRQYYNQAQTTPHPAPIDNLVRSMIIDPKRATENRAELKKHGFDNTQIDNIILSYYRTVDEGTLRTCYLREIISEETLYERMHELGYTDTRIKEIVQTWEVIPGPGDLFTMVAKEAFEPDMYSKLGLDQEFPSEQVTWLKKQGISEYWAKKYWYAHWEQPSIGQGFEMLHRGVIDTDTLDLLFRAVEIPSFWRDKLTKIAYMPYTRVDTRRMHDHGVLSDEELIRSYLDQGYDPEKALKMAQFTVKYNASHEKELTRSTILSAYKKGLIDRADVINSLTEQDYSPELADYYATYTDFQIEQETQDILFDNIRESYMLNAYTTNEAKSKLNSMGMKANKVDAFIANWSIEKYKYELLPTKSELSDFFLNGLISEDQYRQLMSRHGYSASSINLYVNRLEQEEPATQRMPSKAELQKWLQKSIITEDQYIERMTILGYSKFHIDCYLFEMKAIKEVPIETEIAKKPTKTELGRFFIKGLITEVDFRKEMKVLGYTDEIITRFEIDLGKIPSRTDLGRFLLEGLITVEYYIVVMKSKGYNNEDIQRYLTELSYKVTD